MNDSTDPAVTLEHKLSAFAATLNDDERTVLHDVMHLAREGAEVEGFAFSAAGLVKGGDPCCGGEVTFPGTFTLIGNLHVSLHHRVRPPGPPSKPPGPPT